MSNSPDHPQLRFVQAKGFTPGRPDGPPLWIVVHSMEATETSTRAESTAAYFANPGDGRSVSSHYTVDSDSVVQCVLLRDTAWTVGNRPGNNRGINWELSGFARQSREDWLDPFGLVMFAQMAPIVQADAAQFNIPLRRCTISDLVNRRPGITSHNDLRIAFGGTTHTDPGPNFPWDVFLTIITEDGMPLSKEDLVNIWGHDLKDGDGVDKAYWVLNRAAAGVADLQARPPVQAAPVDPAALKAVLLDPEVLAAIAKAVNDDAHARSAA